MNTPLPPIASATAPATAFTAAADGWYPVVPIGIEHRIRLALDGREQDVTEVFDAESARAIAAAFGRASAAPNFPGILVDLEHHSRTPEARSEAAAWIDALEVRADALYAHFRHTDLGDELISSGRYRMLSPVVRLQRIGPGRVRPVELVSVGLTNVPDLAGHLAPLSHRAPDGAPHNTHNPQMEDSRMEAILEALGLASDATPEDVLAAIAALKASAETAEHTAEEVDAAKKEKEEAEHAAEEAEKKREEAEHRLHVLETAQREREADAFVAQHRACIADASAVRKRYLADPEGTRALVAALAAPGAAPDLALHRAHTRTPSTPDTLSAARETLLAQVAAAQGCTRAQAWNLARTQRPDLF